MAKPDPPTERVHQWLIAVQVTMQGSRLRLPSLHCYYTTKIDIVKRMFRYTIEEELPRGCSLSWIGRTQTTTCASMQRDSGPYIIPVAILSEIGWFLDQRFPPRVQAAFLKDLRIGAYTLDWASVDVARIERLARTYADLPLGIADVAVIACAERNGARILSLDHYFQVVARGEKGLLVLPG
jgi:predicted nucleic acid-binding protein